MHFEASSQQSQALEEAIYMYARMPWISRERVELGQKVTASLHTVMRRKAIAYPPALLEASSAAPMQPTTAFDVAATPNPAAEPEEESSATVAVPGDYCDELKLPEESRLPAQDATSDSSMNPTLEYCDFRKSCKMYHTFQRLRDA